MFGPNSLATYLSTEQGPDKREGRNFVLWSRFHLGELQAKREGRYNICCGSVLDDCTGVLNLKMPGPHQRGIAGFEQCNASTQIGRLV
jgi:hypothetical protein